MEPWQYAVVAVPALVLIISIVKIVTIVRAMRRAQTISGARRAAAPDENTDPQPVVEADPDRGLSLLDDDDDADGSWRRPA